MKYILIFFLLMYVTSCVKKTSRAEIDCGGCGLKNSGKKYQNLKKQEKRK
jgi:hypothetical protein